MPRTVNYQANSYEGTVLRVVDGDTLWVQLDMGCRISYAAEMRLIGIDTPERSDKGAWQAAKEYLERLLPVDQLVVCRLAKDPEKYGRWLAAVWRAPVRKYLEDGASVNALMVSEGHAVQYEGGARG